LEASTGAHQHGHGHYAHEKTDAGVHNVAILAGAFVGLLVFGLIVGYGTYRFMYTPETTTLVPSLEPSRVMPPGPRLQVNAHEDLNDYIQEQQHTLDSYGWIDQSAGVVRIPIDRAMDLLLQKGLPARAPGATAEGAKSATKNPASGERATSVVRSATAPPQR
jgi:hypothetical protein